ncbi:hypothetical protein [Anaeromyxobacter oryzae]|uniref:Lipoprotein n=1 Tax=Anaeromyxobacter oryzae TaxID=2918170 RepID=A0ABM7WNK6_9BACT|nr:hypothetical protein [Anaeromyxobacter oryzae]BDG01048.1 hypothetical protein AMOR_00440 [Anaeromyxobacter oryzae]
MRTRQEERGRLLVPAFAATALATQLACGVVTEGIGRCGAYTDTPGTARITVVEAAPADQSNCTNDPVRVLFDFTPADADLVASRAARDVQLTIGSGQNPPRAWVTASGLTIGSEHPAIRSDQPVGPCKPVVLKLTDVDGAAGLSACY